MKNKYKMADSKKLRFSKPSILKIVFDLSHEKQSKITLISSPWGLGPTLMHRTVKNTIILPKKLPSKVWYFIKIEKKILTSLSAKQPKFLITLDKSSITLDQGNLLKAIVIWFVRRKGIEPIKSVSSLLLFSVPCFL